jgi:FkbM family methyltransferase
MRPFKHFFNLILRPFNYETVELGHRQKTSPFLVQASLVTKKNPVIFDGGANTGNISDRYLKMYPGASIHSFEPFPDAFQGLKKRFEGVPSVHANETALSDVDGTALFNSNSVSYTNSLLDTDPLGEKTWEEKGIMDTKSKLKVTTTRIDSYCAANSISVIDILKLDVQGSELKALQGASALLAKKQIGIVYMEMILGASYVGQPQFEDYLRFFKEKDYVLLDLYNPIRKNMRLIQTDVLFVPSRD